MPVGFLEDVILARRYTEAYYANKTDPMGWGSSKIRALAKEIEHELVQEQINKNG